MSDNSAKKPKTPEAAENEFFKLLDKLTPIIPMISENLGSRGDEYNFLNYVLKPLIRQQIKKNGVSNKVIETFIEKFDKFWANCKQLYELIEKYVNNYIGVDHFGEIQESGTPFIIACEIGRLWDVKKFVELYRFLKYIPNRGLNGYRDDMTLKDYINQVGLTYDKFEYTPLMASARRCQLNVIQYLINHGADPNIAHRDGENALHMLLSVNNTSNNDIVKTFRFLLEYMTLDSINKEDGEGDTPLDWVYLWDDTIPIRQEMITLLRSKGGIANRHDENGNFIGLEDEEDEDSDLDYVDDIDEFVSLLKL